MRQLVIVSFILFLICGFYTPAFAVDIAARISDREIIESLAQLKVEHRSIDKRFDSIDKRFESVDKRFDDVNSRLDDMNKRFDSQQNIMLFFITIFLGILGYLIKAQRHFDQRQTKIETSLETYKDEIAWLKEMITKLLSTQKT